MPTLLAPQTQAAATSFLIANKTYTLLTSITTLKKEEEEKKKPTPSPLEKVLALFTAFPVTLMAINKQATHGPVRKQPPLPSTTPPLHGAGHISPCPTIS